MLMLMLMLICDQSIQYWSEKTLVRGVEIKRHANCTNDSNDLYVSVEV